MSKESGCHEIPKKCRAVDRDERTEPSFAFEMQPSRQDVLSRSAFAPEQNDAIGFCCSFGISQNVLHGRALAREKWLCAGKLDSVLGGDALSIECPPNDLSNLIRR